MKPQRMLDLFLVAIVVAWCVSAAYVAVLMLVALSGATVDSQIP